MLEKPVWVRRGGPGAGAARARPGEVAGERAAQRPGVGRRAEQRPEIGEHVVRNFGDNMFGGDFVFSVSREFLRQCQTPLLVMPGDDPPHPAVIGEEIIELAPNVEALRQWKGPEHLRAAIDCVSEFLERHTPR